MISPELSATFYGLASAVSWGAGDFSGGFATKRTNVYGVVIVSQLIGAICLIVVTWLLMEPFPSPVDLLYGVIAGISGAIGLVALYRGLAGRRMGVVAPVAAVVAAVFPVVIGIFLEGIPANQQLVGFLSALIAVWFISRADEKANIRLRELGLPLVAGLGFGLFFIFIDRVSAGVVLWPLVAAKLGSTSMLFVVVTLQRRIEVPNVRELPIIALAGILDTGGNAFFAMATQLGRLDIAVVLGSLYPASTILLAWLILKERLRTQQWVGVLMALIAVVLLSS